MTDNRIMRSFTLDKELDKGVNLVAQLTGFSKSDIVENAVADFIERNLETEYDLELSLVRARRDKLVRKLVKNIKDSNEYLAKKKKELEEDTNA